MNGLVCRRTGVCLSQSIPSYTPLDTEGRGGWVVSWARALLEHITLKTTGRLQLLIR